MTKNLKKRHLFVALVAVLILISMTACKNTVEPAVSDTVATTTGSEETATTTDAATTEAITTATTVTTTKAPTTTTRTPNATAKPVVDQTTKATTTQTQTVKTQLDANGRPRQVKTPEQICKEQKWNAEQYNNALEITRTHTCEYCGTHNCESIVYLKDANGNAYSWSTNKWKCPAYVASEPKCDRCGKKLCEDYDANHPKGEYCVGKSEHVYFE